MELEKLSSSSTADDFSEPMLPPDSPGSSISSRMQEEYDELLKYAVVVPSYDPTDLPRTLTDLRGSFPLRATTTTTTTTQHLRTMTQRHQQQVEAAETSTESTEQVDDEDYEEEDVSETETVETDSEHGRRESTPLQGRSPEVMRAARPYPPIHLTPQGTGVATKLFTQEVDSPESIRSQTNDKSPGSTAGYSSAVDPDVARMEGLLDTWTGDLKRNILAEFTQAKIKIMENQRHAAQKERERHAAEMTQTQNEIENMKELLHTYEQSIERKDEVISNLTRGMQKQRDKFEMLKTFCDWKIRHNDQKREAFASNLARRHYHRTICQKVWDSWHAIVEAKWKQRVERACQSKAQEVCMGLTNDYETKVKSLNEALEAARLEVQRLHEERDRYEETMKKAFMRGVCALNLEAMTMFHDQEEVPPGGSTEQQAPQAYTQGEYDLVNQFAQMPGSMTVAQEPVYISEPPGAPLPRVVTSQGGGSRVSQVRQTTTTAKSTAATRSKMAGKSKVVSAKVTARTDSGRGHSLGGANVPMGLAPPMSSVVVERHQPVVKQTIGHAIASQYPRDQGGRPATILQRKIAGQSGQVPITTPNVQTIKVVE